MRNEFVGILFAVDTILFLYQGITRLEDYALNLAGVFALGIALFPMTWPVAPDSKDNPFSLHGTLREAPGITESTAPVGVRLFRRDSNRGLNRAGDTKKDGQIREQS
jgi:hypothetical protein